MLKSKFVAGFLAIAGMLVISSCETYKPNANVVYSQYIASTVTPTSAGAKDVNFEVLKPMTVSATVEYAPGGLISGQYIGRQIYIDGALVYDYEYNQLNEERQWLKSFNSDKLELGFLFGSTDSNNTTHPNPSALSRQIAYAKIFKELIAVKGDAITTPVITTLVNNKGGKTEYTTTVKTYIVKLNPTK